MTNTETPAPFPALYPLAPAVLDAIAEGRTVVYGPTTRNGARNLSKSIEWHPAAVSIDYGGGFGDEAMVTVTPR